MARTAFSISGSGGSPVGSSALKGTKSRSIMPSSAWASATTSRRTMRCASSTQVPSLEIMRRRTTAYVPVTRPPVRAG